MPPTQDTITPHLSALTSSISTLPTALKPLLIPSKSRPSLKPTKAALLQRAKSTTLTAYAINSLLYSAISLSGANAKEHPVFKELQRTRTYFEKIAATEKGEEKPTMRVDKEAVGRFVKAGLSGAVSQQTGMGKLTRLDGDEVKTGGKRSMEVDQDEEKTRRNKKDKKGRFFR